MLVDIFEQLGKFLIGRDGILLSTMQFKIVYSSVNLAMVYHFKNLLATHGIDSWIKNEFLSGAAGQLPLTECWPKLCVAEEYYEEAKKWVDRALAFTVKTNDHWKCPSCGEELEAQFTECWNCGSVSQ